LLLRATPIRGFKVSAFDIKAGFSSIDGKWDAKGFIFCKK